MREGYERDPKGDLLGSVTAVKSYGGQLGELRRAWAREIAVIAALDAAGLSFTPANGSFQILVHNKITGLTETNEILVDLNGLDGDAIVTEHRADMSLHAALATRRERELRDRIQCRFVQHFAGRLLDCEVTWQAVWRHDEEDNDHSFHSCLPGDGRVLDVAVADLLP